VLYIDHDYLQVVDLGSVKREGGFALYETLVLEAPPPFPMLPDELRYSKEADCAGEATRMLSRHDFRDGNATSVQLFAHPEHELTDWTEVDPAELRMACAREPGAGTVLPDAKSLHATFEALLKGLARDLRQASTMR
jgi:hypothetical protein